MNVVWAIFTDFMTLYNILEFAMLKWCFIIDQFTLSDYLFNEIDQLRFRYFRLAYKVISFLGVIYSHINFYSLVLILILILNDWLIWIKHVV